MQLIDCSHSASYSQRAFPFSSSVSVDHESTNDATELCSLSEFARKLHTKTQNELSQLPVDIQEQFVPTPQPEYVTHLTVSGMSDLRKSHTRQQLTKAIDFLMEQEFLISRKINEQAREKKEKNQEFSIDSELDNLLFLLEEHRDLVRTGVQRETDEYMRFQKSKKLCSEEEDQQQQQPDQKEIIRRKPMDTISEEPYCSDREQMRKHCYQYLLSHCKFQGNAGEDGENIITFKWKLTQEEKQQVQQLKNDIFDAESVFIESNECLPQKQKKERKKYEENNHEQDPGSNSNYSKNNHGYLQIHSEIKKIEFQIKEPEDDRKQQQEEDSMQQLYRSIMEADSLDDLLGKTAQQNLMNSNSLSDFNETNSQLSTNLANQENHNSRKVNRTAGDKQDTIKSTYPSKDEETVLKVISINDLDLMNYKDKLTNEQTNQKGFGNIKLFSHGTISKQENKLPQKVQMNLSRKLISDTWKPKGIENQNLNCIKELRN